MPTAIKVENLSKAYQLGQFGTNTISGDVQRWWMTKILGKEDPFLKIGERNDRSLKGESNMVWSLKDINFEVQQGEALGIIGQNGAGKSTLLKILSRVTSPTQGGFKIKGRVASLLEVGTGFHPELTGKENIFLNGAILGMRKHEIKKRLDEIVDFAGIERYLETPVKRYSSGMYVRLAFAVAAHLDAEILVVDEVLAVGDAEFQKKCLGKMGDISKGQGRTILFVSHNIASVQNLCTNGLLLSHGKTDFYGKIDDAIIEYLPKNICIENTSFDNVERKGNGKIKFTNYEVKDLVTGSSQVVLSGNDVEFNLEYVSLEDTQLKDCLISIGVRDDLGNLVFNCPSNVLGVNFNIFKKGILTCKIPKIPLKEGRYTFNLFAQYQGELSDWIIKGGKFEVVTADFYKTGILPDHKRGVLVNFDWNCSVI